MWGAEDATEMEAILDEQAYAVEFNFFSGGAGYVEKYFVFAGTVLFELVLLIRKIWKLVLL